MKKNSNARRILITILLIVAIMGISFYMATSVYHLAEDQCWERLNDSAWAVNEQFVQKMTGEADSLKARANSFATMPDLKGEALRAQVANMRTGITHSPVRMIFPDGEMINENGAIVALDSGGTFGRLYTEVTCFKGAEPDVIFPNIDTMLCIAPVMREGKVSALLVKYINLQVLPALVNNTNFGGAIRAAFADKDTKDIILDTGHDVKSRDMDEMFNKCVIIDKKPKEVLNRMKSGVPGQFVFQDYQTGQREFMHYMPSSAYNWIVMTYIPERVIFSDANSIKNLFSIFGCVEVVILIAYLIWILKDTLAQIDRVVLQERLTKAEQAEKAKTTFLFNMSHDIRTPMNAIMGYTGIAKSHIDDKERVEDCLNKIDISGLHLLEIINDVLDMARIESGNVVVEERPMDILDCTEEIIIMCKALANSRHVSIGLSSDDVKNRMVYGDLVHINEVLMNVASNAIKYTETGGKVTVGIKQREPYLEDYGVYEFVIEDNGIGMSEEFLAKIFDTFARERNSTVSGIEGTGLGMSIVKKLVELMGGTIDIQSEQGKGTKVTICFTLKLCAEEGDELGESAAALSLQGMRVLLTEDNEMNREIARTILEESGLLVEEAEDGTVALEKVSMSEPGYYDFVLMDIQMPVMNGYEATQRIRELDNKALARIPIIAMTANAFGEDKERALKAGMNAHIAKPVDFKKLFETLQSLITERPDS